MRVLTITGNGPFCPACFGERDPSPYLPQRSSDGESVVLAQCMCNSRLEFLEPSVTLSTIAANPVMFAALTEYHIRNSKTVIVVCEELL